MEYALSTQRSERAQLPHNATRVPGRLGEPHAHQARSPSKKQSLAASAVAPAHRPPSPHLMDTARPPQLVAALAKLRAATAAANTRLSEVENELLEFDRDVCKTSRGLAMHIQALAATHDKNGSADGSDAALSKMLKAGRRRQDDYELKTLPFRAGRRRRDKVRNQFLGASAAHRVARRLQAAFRGRAARLRADAEATDRLRDAIPEAALERVRDIRLANTEHYAAIAIQGAARGRLSREGLAGLAAPTVREAMCGRMAEIRTANARHYAAIAVQARGRGVLSRGGFRATQAARSEDGMRESAQQAEEIQPAEDHNAAMQAEGSGSEVDEAVPRSGVEAAPSFMVASAAGPEAVRARIARIREENRAAETSYLES